MLATMAPVAWTGNKTVLKGEQCWTGCCVGYGWAVAKLDVTAQHQIYTSTHSLQLLLVS